MKKLSLFFVLAIAGMFVITGCGTSGNGTPGSDNDSEITPDSCGNGQCETGENCANCATDCRCTTGQTCQNGVCLGLSSCGNAKCESDKDENCSTCPDDCGCTTGQACQSGQCVTIQSDVIEPDSDTVDAVCTPKTCTDLALECGKGDDGCGNTVDCGTCSDGRTCQSGQCVPIRSDVIESDSDTVDAVCTPKTCTDLVLECGKGDDSCGGQVDCGTCAQGKICTNGKCVTSTTCGNGTCDANENCNNCATDCGCTTGRKCYNNACCTPKTCTDLALECGKGDDSCGGQTEDCGTCDQGKICTNGKCVTSTTCGNGTCDTNENCNNCATDCGCTGTQVCAVDGKCVDCTTEGNTFAIGMGTCCAGLTKISTAKPGTSGACPNTPPIGASLCAHCGNSTCDADKGENKCNCPGDCSNVCQPKTCTDLGFTCGLGDDSCGTMVNCNACGTGQGTCQGGTCSLLPDCKTLNGCMIGCTTTATNCINKCAANNTTCRNKCTAGDTNCKNKCLNGASKQAVGSFNGLYGCLNKNNCWDANNELIQTCLDAHCNTKYYQCFSGDTYLSCNDLTSCINACTSGDTVCIGKCWDSAYPTAANDLNGLLACLNQTCQVQCQNPKSQKCTNCRKQAMDHAGACYDKIQACTDHQPYDGGTCSGILSCGNACKDTHCLYRCVYAGKNDSQKLYNDLITCVTQTCQTACRVPKSQACTDCWNQVQSNGGACNDKVNACSNG